MPESEHETIAGFVTDELDRIPEVGDEVALDAGMLRVERVDGARVRRLSFTPSDTATDYDPVRTHDQIIDELKKDLT